jgi:hypothetical protein
MGYEIEGKIHDSKGAVLSGILVVARNRSILDTTLGQDTSDNNGSFNIKFHKWLFKPNTYLVISDPKKQYISIRDNQTARDYTKVIHCLHKILF